MAFILMQSQSILVLPEFAELADISLLGRH
jgi:hypothetical protein